MAEEETIVQVEEIDYSIPMQLMAEYLDGSKNPVTCVMEYCSKKKLVANFYEVAVENVTVHSAFGSVCSIGEVDYPQGTGKSKKEAKTNAAINAFNGLLNADTLQTEAGKIAVTEGNTADEIGNDPSSQLQGVVSETDIGTHPFVDDEFGVHPLYDVDDMLTSRHAPIVIDGKPHAPWMTHNGLEHIAKKKQKWLQYQSTRDADDLESYRMSRNECMELIRSLKSKWEEEHRDEIEAIRLQDASVSNSVENMIETDTTVTATSTSQSTDKFAQQGGNAGIFKRFSVEVNMKDGYSLPKYVDIRSKIPISKIRLLQPSRYRRPREGQDEQENEEDVVSEKKAGGKEVIDMCRIIQMEEAAKQVLVEHVAVEDLLPDHLTDLMGQCTCVDYVWNKSHDAEKGRLLYYCESMPDAYRFTQRLKNLQLPRTGHIVDVGDAYSFDHDCVGLSTSDFGYHVFDEHAFIRSVLFVSGLPDTAETSDIYETFPQYVSMVRPCDEWLKQLGYCILTFRSHNETIRNSKRRNVEVCSQPVSMIVISFPPSEILQDRPTSLNVILPDRQKNIPFQFREKAAAESEENMNVVRAVRNKLMKEGVDVSAIPEFHNADDMKQYLVREIGRTLATNMGLNTNVDQFQLMKNLPNIQGLGELVQNLNSMFPGFLGTLARGGGPRPFMGPRGFPGRGFGPFGRGPMMRPMPPMGPPVDYFGNGPRPLFDGPGPLFDGPGPLFDEPGHFFDGPGPRFEGLGPFFDEPGPVFDGPMMGRPRRGGPRFRTGRGRGGPGSFGSDFMGPRRFPPPGMIDMPRFQGPRPLLPDPEFLEPRRRGAPFRSRPSRFDENDEENAAPLIKKMKVSAEDDTEGGSLEMSDSYNLGFGTGPRENSAPGPRRTQMQKPRSFRENPDYSSKSGQESRNSAGKWDKPTRPMPKPLLDGAKSLGAGRFNTPQPQRRNMASNEQRNFGTPTQEPMSGPKSAGQFNYGKPVNQQKYTQENYQPDFTRNASQENFRKSNQSFGQQNVGQYNKSQGFGNKPVDRQYQSHGGSQDYSDQRFPQPHQQSSLGKNSAEQQNFNKPFHQQGQSQTYQQPIGQSYQSSAQAQTSTQAYDQQNYGQQGQSYTQTPQGYSQQYSQSYQDYTGQANQQYTQSYQGYGQSNPQYTQYYEQSKPQTQSYVQQNTAYSQAHVDPSVNYNQQTEYSQSQLTATQQSYSQPAYQQPTVSLQYNYLSTMSSSQVGYTAYTQSTASSSYASAYTAPVQNYMTGQASAGLAYGQTATNYGTAVPQQYSVVTSQTYAQPSAYTATYAATNQQTQLGYTYDQSQYATVQPYAQQTTQYTTTQQQQLQYGQIQTSQ